MFHISVKQLLVHLQSDRSSDFKDPITWDWQYYFCLSQQLKFPHCSLEKFDDASSSPGIWLEVTLRVWVKMTQLKRRSVILFCSSLFPPAWHYFCISHSSFSLAGRCPWLKFPLTFLHYIFKAPCLIERGYQQQDEKWIMGGRCYITERGMLEERRSRMPS